MGSYPLGTYRWRPPPARRIERKARHPKPGGAEGGSREKLLYPSVNQGRGTVVLERWCKQAAQRSDAMDHW